MHFPKGYGHGRSPESVRRQFETTHMAMRVLGTGAALGFMNRRNSALGERPIDLVVASDEGCARVRAELRKVAGNCPPTGE